MTRIGLVTYRSLPRLNDDDRLLADALSARGAEVKPAVWDSPRVDWAGFDLLVIRSAWDYHLRLEEFLGWLARMETLDVPMWNPPEVMRWNTHKHYLVDLAEKGIATIPTLWLKCGQMVVLGPLIQEQGWGEVVVKPVVSATANNTWRTSRWRARADQPRLNAMLTQCDVMIQPFVEEICTKGEWSFLYADGRFSHAVLKQPAPGDFRVQEEWGGEYQPAKPPAKLRKQADAVVKAVDAPLLYARVDGVERDGQLVVTELELIEPQLYFGTDPASATRFAKAVLSHVA